MQRFRRNLCGHTFFKLEASRLVDKMLTHLNILETIYLSRHHMEVLVKVMSLLKVISSLKGCYQTPLLVFHINVEIACGGQALLDIDSSCC